MVKRSLSITSVIAIIGGCSAVCAADWLFSDCNVNARPAQAQTNMAQDMTVRTGEPTRLKANGGIVDVIFMPGSEFHLSKRVYIDWLQTAANAVAAYYGRFPVERLVVKISSEPGDDIGFATTGYEDGAAVIEIPVGVDMTAEKLDRDWTATHEMTHLAFPLMDQDHKWLAEGQATYIEPLARLRVGKYSAKKVWGDLLANLPEGLPERGDRGLNNTHTWGRTYWGGALYCLIADLRIREKTSNRKGLVDAVSAIASTGGNIASDWGAEDALAVGDRAIGTDVLGHLYHEMKDSAFSPNLQQIWDELGVRKINGRIELDDNAPRAAVRQAIEGGKVPQVD